MAAYLSTGGAGIAHHMAGRTGRETQGQSKTNPSVSCSQSLKKAASTIAFQGGLQHVRLVVVVDVRASCCPATCFVMTYGGL